MIQSVIFILILVGHVKPDKRNENVFLKLPAVVSRFVSFSDTKKLINIIKLFQGEYRMIFKSMRNCKPVNDKIQFNYYLNKKSDNSTELKGNITALTPIDDSLSVR